MALWTSPSFWLSRTIWSQAPLNRRSAAESVKRLSSETFIFDVALEKYRIGMTMHSKTYLYIGI